MKAGRALELSEIQAKELENHGQTVNAVKCNKKEDSTHLEGKQRHQQNRQESRTRYESHNRSNSRKDDGKCRTVVDHTLTKTHVLRKKRSVNPMGN